MRLFVAIPLPKFVRCRLSEVKQPIEGVRWQRPDQLHVTLKFLGDVSEQRTSLLISELKDIHHHAFTMTIKGFGYFSRGSSPVVLWAGISNSKELHKLYQRVEERCVGMGFQPESRAFKPHVTVGRMQGVSESDVISFINEHRQFVIPKVEVNEFVLFESTLDPGGAVHEKAERFQFNTS